jgi:hypothetical protein
VTRPSSQRESATFSLVASAWTSTTDHRRLRPRLLDELVDHLEHRDRRREEERAHDVDHGHLGSVLGGSDRQPAAGRELREVRGPDHALGGLEIAVDLGATPGVVAERDHVRARGQNPGGELRGDPDAVGEVLSR